MDHDEMATARPPGLHIVLGAGPPARAIARLLVGNGEPVRMVSRSGKHGLEAIGVETVKADLSVPGVAESAIEGATIVYHCAAPAYHRWVQEFEALQSQIVKAAISKQVPLVVLENLYGYGATGVLTEDLLFNATGPKGRIRAKLTNELIAASKAGDLSMVIARSSDFVGPEVLQSSLGERFWPALLAEKPIDWVGGFSERHSYTAISDLARAMVALGRSPSSYGQAWHVPCLPPITPREIAAKAAKAAGVGPPKMRVTPKIMLRMIGLFVPAAREVLEVAYQYEAPFIVSSDRYQVAIEKQAPDWDTVLAETVAWWRTRS